MKAYLGDLFLELSRRSPTWIVTASRVSSSIISGKDSRASAMASSSLHASDVLSSSARISTVSPNSSMRAISMLIWITSGRSSMFVVLSLRRSMLLAIPSLRASQARASTSDVSKPVDSSWHAPMRSMSSSSPARSARAMTSLSLASSDILGKVLLRSASVSSLAGSGSSRHSGIQSSSSS